MIDSLSEEFLLNYTYSKKSHLNQFIEKGYDIELYGRNLNIQDDVDLITYQNLMIYSFLKDKKGLKILQIENTGLISFEKLQKNHECWKIDIENIVKPVNEMQFTPIPFEKEIKIDNPAFYFDFIFLPFTFNTVPKEIEIFKVILSNIKQLLKANGILLSSFMNLLINGQLYPDKIFDLLSKDKNIINKMERFSKIDTDNDLFVLPENFYNKYWKEYTEKSYNEFGKAFCYNLFIENKGKIYPENFPGFTYIKKSHKDFFITNGYAEELLGKEKNKEFDSIDFKSLLVFSYIKSNFKKGDKILQIGNAPEYLESALGREYDFFKLESLEQLEDSLYFNAENLQVTKNGKRINLDCKNVFNFTFSLVNFDGLEYNPFRYSIIVNNIDKIMKMGGFVLFSFTSLISDNMVNHTMFLCYLFNNFVFRLSKLDDDEKVLNDDDIYLTDKNKSENAGQLKSKLKQEAIFNILWKKILYLPVASQTKPNNRLKKYPVYIFHHLMKCGGTSLFVALEKWFKTIDDNILLEDLNSYVEKKFNINIFHNEICLRAHFQRPGIYLHERYPELLERKNECRIFTFIRDPLSIKISKHYFLKAINAMDKDFNIKKDLLSESNFIANLLPCNEKNYKEVIDRYYFVGIVEKFQESFDIFADLIGKKKVVIPYLNTTKKDSQLDNLTPDFMKEFKLKNKLDYDIYDYCLEKFSKFSKN